MKIVIDTYAWIELLIGSEKGYKVKQYMENADEIYTPGTVLAETARKFLRDGVDGQTITIWLEVIIASSEIAQIDSTTALEAAKCQLELGQKAKNSKLNTPSLFDAIVLATARIKQCKILTADEHFKNLPETIWIN